MISTTESVHKVQRWSENYAVTLPHAQNVWISKSNTQCSKTEMFPLKAVVRLAEAPLEKRDVRGSIHLLCMISCFLKPTQKEKLFQSDFCYLKAICP